MRWVVRVYALVADAWGRYVVLEEEFRGARLLKFPGGGVQPHEGLRDALQRELIEELGTPATTMEHFYTQDFLQYSYYHPDTQLLAIYYKVTLAEDIRPMNPRLRFFWLYPALMQLSLPVDRYVQRLLLQERGGPLPPAPANTDRQADLLERPCSSKHE